MPGRLWVSVPLVPGVHDRDELDRMAQFIVSLEPVPPVRVLPYQRLGEPKYAALGLPGPDFAGDAGALAETARAIFRDLGIRLIAPAA